MTSLCGILVLWDFHDNHILVVSDPGCATGSLDVIKYFPSCLYGWGVVWPGYAGWVYRLLMKIMKLLDQITGIIVLLVLPYERLLMRALRLLDRTGITGLSMSPYDVYLLLPRSILVQCLLFIGGRGSRLNSRIHVHVHD